jgi:hypothetical protein
MCPVNMIQPRMLKVEKQRTGKTTVVSYGHAMKSSSCEVGLIRGNYSWYLWRHGKYILHRIFFPFETVLPDKQCHCGQLLLCTLTAWLTKYFLWKLTN